MLEIWLLLNNRYGALEQERFAIFRCVKKRGYFIYIRLTNKVVLNQYFQFIFIRYGNVIYQAAHFK